MKSDLELIYELDKEQLERTERIIKETSKKIYELRVEKKSLKERLKKLEILVKRRKEQISVHKIELEVPINLPKQKVKATKK